MDGRAWNSGYRVTVDGWQSGQWVSEVNSIREVARIFDEHGIQVSHSKVYHIQTQRDDREAGRPITRAIGERGERRLQHTTTNSCKTTPPP